MRVGWILLTLLCVVDIQAQSISEKKEMSAKGSEGHFIEAQVATFNEEIAGLRTALEAAYARVQHLHTQGAHEEEYQGLLQQVAVLKKRLIEVEKTWRETAVSEAKREEEGYALWDQEETTLTQLVMEYGSMDFLYIVPPEMASLKLYMHSAIPIPRESWSEVLEVILAHNGVGVKKLNTYARQLFLFKQDPSAVQNMASKPEELHLIPNNSRLFYVLSPPVEQTKSVLHFFERFIDGKQTFAYQISNKVILVSSKEEVEKLLALYQTVWQNPSGKVCRVLPVSKVSAKEMEKIIHAFFGDGADKGRPPFSKGDAEGLMLFSLGQGSLVMVGQKDAVERAEEIAKETEAQLQDPLETTIFLYTCRHSNPQDLAQVLEKVYVSLLASPTDIGKETIDFSYNTQGSKPGDGFPQVAPLVVTPPSLKPGVTTQAEMETSSSEHFIADPKTGTLLMVVRRDALVKLKELIRKLDVPKRMVQIDVLLFEKRLDQQTKFGLNLLKLGSHSNGLEYTGLYSPAKEAKGVLSFFFHGGGSKYLPAFDLAYNFLMTQEDVQLHAAPSVTTVNQTATTITIVEEISLNNGAAPVNTSSGQLAFQNTYTRAQFGITIVVTPTVHPPAEGEEGKGCVTMQTNITFDTTKHSQSSDGRPPVERRHIENEVRVADGQTVILGGLRRKSTRDNLERVPFLGELPGIGKLFGSTELLDSSTEMIFFITPTIILDPKDEMIHLREEQLKKRPGDIPEFLDRVVEAQRKQEQHFFQQSMKMFGRPGYEPN